MRTASCYERGFDMVQRGVLIVISGFSGAGKGTVVKEITRRNENIALSVSMTTRSPREGEVNGREYFFVSKDEFEKAIENDELVEYANYVGNYYGTPKKYVEDMLSSGRDVILEIETQGALQIKKKFPDAVLVFVTTPSFEVLKSRLVGRGTESEEVISNRLRKAGEETQYMMQYDFVLVNDVLEKTIEDMNTIINASHKAPACNEVFINKIIEDFKAYR